MRNSEVLKILLVEDDPNLGFVIKDNLEDAGYMVILCADGESGLKTFQNKKFNLCILDIMLPKKDGFSLAESIRARNEQIPIIFLTAKSMKEDRIKGFKIGADDYITKPFSMEELLLRINVFVKRSLSDYSIPNNEIEEVKIGRLVFDYPNLTLTGIDHSEKLTRKEAEILLLFSQNKEAVLKREHILKSVWGENDYFLGRSLDVFISRIRKYLKMDPTLRIINYHKVGFKLTDQEQ